jgi:hypothetical protein
LLESFLHRVLFEFEVVGTYFGFWASLFNFLEPFADCGKENNWIYVFYFHFMLLLLYPW